jgi:hypothetical protein
MWAQTRNATIVAAQAPTVAIAAALPDLVARTGRCSRVPVDAIAPAVARRPTASDILADPA